jgi:hypothetical protein
MKMGALSTDKKYKVTPQTVQDITNRVMQIMTEGYALGVSTEFSFQSFSVLVIQCNQDKWPSGMSWDDAEDVYCKISTELAYLQYRHTIKHASRCDSNGENGTLDRFIAVAVNKDAEKLADQFKEMLGKVRIGEEKLTISVYGIHTESSKPRIDELVKSAVEMPNTRTMRPGGVYIDDQR